MARPAVAEINLENIRGNFRLAASMSSHGKTVAVVKADAYGHGLVEVAESLSQDTEVFAVASIEEAMVLRASGIRHPVLLMEGFFEDSELDVIVKEGFWTVIHNEQQLGTLAQSRLPKPIPVWLKVDTGMHRLGFNPKEAAQAYATLKALKQVQSVVVMTHLANADHELSDRVSVEAQLSKLPITLTSREIELSIANSAALLDHPSTRKHWQRPVANTWCCHLAPTGASRRPARKKWSMP